VAVYRASPGTDGDTCSGLLEILVLLQISGALGTTVVVNWCIYMGRAPIGSDMDRILVLSNPYPLGFDSILSISNLSRLSMDKADWMWQKQSRAR
jgi:hypothetical protein